MAVDDVSCRCVAVDFYRELFNAQGTNQGHEVVSAAFYNAVIELRQGLLRQPIMWASFIRGHN